MSEASKYTFEDCAIVKAFNNFYYLVPYSQREHYE